MASVATQTATDDKRLAEKKEEERKGRRKKVAAEEETSSTTTETSNADSDLGEKVRREAESVVSFFKTVAL